MLLFLRRSGESTMRFRGIALFLLAMSIGMVAAAQDAPPPGGGAGTGSGQGRGRGWGGFMGGRGVVGTVTEVAADHYTVKNENGETYTVHYSPNTKLFKQPAHRPAPGEMRTPPEEIKPTDIQVGDAIMAQGEVDAAAKSVGAIMVVKIDPERAREMREMQANFGKTWLMGRVTAIQDMKITLQSPVDNAEHTFAVDENTSFRKRREPVTLADVEVGSNVRVEGSVKQGVFIASAVNVMGMPQARGGPVKPEGPAPR
jgi:preprotein translocase subunit YajC